MTSSSVIYDRETLRVIAKYDDMSDARRRLKCAIERGHKLRGYKYPQTMLERMEVATERDFDTYIDHLITVTSVMGGDVTIRKSQRGSPAHDPSMESYWSM